MASEFRDVLIGCVILGKSLELSVPLLVWRIGRLTFLWNVGEKRRCDPSGGGFPVFLHEESPSITGQDSC